MQPGFYRLFETYVKGIKPGNGNQYTGFCPFHPDRKKRSFSFNDENGLWNCFAVCGNGNAYQFAQRFNHPNSEQYLTNGYSKMNNAQIPNIPKTTTTNPSIKKDGDIGQNTPLKQAHLDLINNLERLDSNYNENRSLIPEFWRKKMYSELKVFFENGELYFPHHDQKGEIITIQIHKGAQFGVGKSKWYAPHLFKNYQKDEPLYISEGLMDCITLLSNNYQATSNTTGATNHPKDLELFDGFKEIIIAYDHDKAGRDGAKKLSNAIKKRFIQAKVKVIQWDESLSEKWDISDSFKHDSGKSFKGAVINSTEKRTGFEVINISEYAKLNLEGAKPIIHSILYEKGICVIAGSDNVGKTWIALQSAFSIASGVRLFEYFITYQRTVLLIQFENSNNLIQDRLQKIIPYFQQNTPNDDWIKNFDIIRKNESDEVFTENWKKIEDTIKERGFNNGVLIIDNLYTSTDKNLSRNEDLNPVLKIIDRIRNQFNLSIILIAHHNKDSEQVKSLNKNQITGGKSLTNFVQNVLQIGDSKISKDLRVAKITKIRDDVTELYDIPFKLYFDTNSYIFKKGAIITNEAVHYLECKKRWEIKLIKEFAGHLEHRKDKDFNRETLIPHITKEFEDFFKHPNQLTRYLNKMTQWGLVIKKSRDRYELAFHEINGIED